VARALHNLSSRGKNAFVKLNCAAIPTGLLESELFGHERGAFTGAISQRIGRFELAHNGTVFLDEIGEIPLELQPKLLRVLQEREFERLGGTKTIRSDARLIAATNRDLGTMVDEQKFRQDLFYRLNVFPIRVPPLKERTEDIPLLVRHFVQQFSRRMNKHIDSIPSETMKALVRYEWPGNIRELQNVIERAVILSPGPALRVSLADLKSQPSAKRIEAPAVAAIEAGGNIQSVLDETERAQILRALDQSKGIVSGAEGAAARLGMKRSTLQFRMQRLGIRVSRTSSR
jgi:formate hydrogenlyase transcriptional activator